MRKELMKLANHLDRIGLTKEADLVDGLLKKSFLVPLLMMGCQGKGDLKYNHFAWGIDYDTGDFATTLEGGMAETKYKVAKFEYPNNPEYNKSIKFIIYKISGLKEYLTVGNSFYQGMTEKFTYEDIASGKIYEYLENVESGSVEEFYIFNESDRDSFEMYFVDHNKDNGYEAINFTPDVYFQSYDQAARAATGTHPNITIHDAE